MITPFAGMLALTAIVFFSKFFFRQLNVPCLSDFFIGKQTLDPSRPLSLVNETKASASFEWHREAIELLVEKTQRIACSDPMNA